MKIAHVAWESLHSIAVGGIANHVTEMAAALQRRGHEVHVFVRTGPGQEKFSVIDGVHYHRCPIRVHPDFVTEMSEMCNSLVWHLFESEHFDKKPFDLIHGHDWMCTKAIVQAKNDHKRKTVLTLHSTEFGRCGNVNHGGASSRVRWIEAEGAFVADRVIAVSSALAHEVKQHYQVPDWKLRVIRNGIHCERFDRHVEPGEVRKRYGIGPLDPMALFVGRLSIQKGPDLLIEAIPGILHVRPDAKIVIVGDGYMRRGLEARAHQLGVMHAIRFLGGMDGNGELINLFKSSDCVVVPSRNEPFGIVILEAWAAHKPVVATHNGGPGEIVHHGYNGYLVYDNPDSISWGVKEVFRNFAHARWMGEKGRASAAYGFSWDLMAKQTEEVYQELVGKPLTVEVLREAAHVSSIPGTNGHASSNGKAHPKAALSAPAVKPASALDDAAMS